MGATLLAPHLTFLILLHFWIDYKISHLSSRSEFSNSKYFRFYEAFSVFFFIFYIWCDRSGATPNCIFFQKMKKGGPAIIKNERPGAKTFGPNFYGSGQN